MPAKYLYAAMEAQPWRRPRANCRAAGIYRGISEGRGWLAVGFGLLKYVLSTLGQITIRHAGYGIFRDELYFIVCGRHLAGGMWMSRPSFLWSAHFGVAV